MASASASKKSQNKHATPSSSTSSPPSDAASGAGSAHSGAAINYQGALQPRGFPGLPEGWITDWETFPSRDSQLRLFQVQHRPREQKGGKRALLVLHGLGEHGGRYLHATHFLKDVVDRVVCLDLRGHGRSEGLRGHVDSFDQYTDDLAAAVGRLRAQLDKEWGGGEIHLLAHSLGGHIAIRALQKYPALPITSATVSAPLLGIKMRVPPVKKYAGLLMARLWGTLHMTNEVDPDCLSHDKEVAIAYTTDRLVHNKVTPSFFVQLQNAMASTRAVREGIRVPLQFVIPLGDPVVDPDVSQDYFQKLNHPAKQLKTYPGFFHEPLNEIGKEKVFADVAAWIQRWSKP